MFHSKNAFFNIGTAFFDEKSVFDANVSDEKKAKFRDLRSREECGICRSRQGLSNEYLIAKIGFDTAENGPSEV